MTAERATDYARQIMEQAPKSVTLTLDQWRAFEFYLAGQIDWILRHASESGPGLRSDDSAVPDPLGTEATGRGTFHQVVASGPEDAAPSGR